MQKTAIGIVMSMFLLGAVATPVLGQDQAPGPQNQFREQEQVYGWQLMSEEERSQYQRQMRSMSSAQEREAFRMQHHEMMQERARQQGVTLPDVPRSGGQGMGPGAGAGQQPGAGPGMGQGKQKGPGKKQGQGKKKGSAKKKGSGADLV